MELSQEDLSVMLDALKVYERINLNSLMGSSEDKRLQHKRRLEQGRRLEARLLPEFNGQGTVKEARSVSELGLTPPFLA